MVQDFTIEMNHIDLFISLSLVIPRGFHGKKEIESRIETIMSHTIHDCLVYNTNVLTQE